MTAAASQDRGSVKIGPGSRGRTRLFGGFVAAAGAGIWAIAFGLRLTGVPADWWRWRDDAVITLSHARNLADFGSIGVSPGGDRVEGFSAPLQFALSSIFFTATNGGYGDFLHLQVAVCVILSGALTALILFQTARKAGLPNRASATASCLLTVLAAGVVTSSWTTVGWLVSGMENPFFLVTGLALVAVTMGSPGSSWRPAVVGSLITTVGLVRIEFPVLLLPLWATCLFVVALPQSSVRQTRIATAWIVGIPIVVWSLIHVARWVYFGSFLPNTALVQDRAAGPRQLFMIAATTALFLVWAWSIARPGSERGRHLLGALLVALYVLLWASDSLEYLSPGEGAPIPVVLLALSVTVGVGIATMSRADGRMLSVDALFASLVFVPIAQFLATGPARMEPFRVLSLAVPLLAVWLASVLVRIWASIRMSSETQHVKQRRGSALLVLVTVTAVVGGAGLLYDSVRDMPWRISPSDTQILAVADAVRVNHLGGRALPIVANPDLGKISFRKRAIMVDLGWLGDPTLARMNKLRPDLQTAYLNYVATPDVMEAHATWSCKYGPWIESEEFRSSYALSSPKWASQGRDYDANCPLGGRYAIWIRTTGDAEYELTRTIADASDPISVITAAVTKCVAASGGVFRCQPVRRAVTRNSPMLSERGLLDDAAKAFESSPSYQLDQALLVRSRSWADRAFEAFVDLADLEFRSAAQSA